MYCRECGKEIKGKLYSGELCQNCYNYFRRGGIIHPLPEKGRVEHDKDGKVICHICGKSFVKLGNHIHEVHKMTIKEYKEEFGLCANARTTDDNYNKKMRKLAYEHNMDKQLRIAGKSTRFKKGDVRARKGKEVRLQEIIHKRERKLKQN